ncbi:hypothetical protein BDB00DRAFT_644379 [Zychaea mexicana]|uniref:uncharacterized protein n=1 Tax=Zychaea mexicana TaxID=64656 RepID=UPI0022FE49D7|nr:uncharacterized protein BDB00DRAFT_644379 [Zychaea mexicana]KAI9488947.1 hypothetical protein BDB00DRAFT_644379 [Zychaea mexicana]
MRDSYNVRILGQSLYDKVASSRVLMVGAGGIGCELLKNLVLSGFKHIEIIDLDTIDISNLNRQFLFQKQHVKKSKAHVAKESALRFNPSVDIVSHQANIKDPQFNVTWFSRFTIVFNALDNLEARRHVNQMCLFANIPLVESGTTGYLGQAYVIRKDVTECFDCEPKPTPTTYPVCTIRSTPSQPIHCIVWAKSYLFSQLFGNSEEEDEDLQVKDSDKENAQELEALARETGELKAIKAAMGTDEYAQKVFDKVFTSDIERLLSMKEMWKTREKPVPLSYSAIEKESHNDSTETAQSGLKDQRVWNVKECVGMFKDSIERLSTRLLELKEKTSDAILSFDKDDDDALDFVTATANLRAHIFGIQEKSRFEVKSMAGNIIPAIATTNAIIAGIAVMKGFAVLRGHVETIKRTYLTTVGRQRPLLMLEDPPKPNPECKVCQTVSATVTVDFERAKLSDLLETAIVKGASLDAEEVTMMNGNKIVYDVDLDDNLQTLLTDLGIHAGTILRVASDDDDEIDLVLQGLYVYIQPVVFDHYGLLANTTTLY